MDLICDYIDCTGCMACYNVCPKSAISMCADKEGFLHPHIDESLCINCKLCINVCPVKNPVIKHNPIQIYSGWSKNEDIRIASSSGGAFTEIALYILNHGGVVFGVILNEKLEAIHSYIENGTDLEQMRGSKYVQSNINDSFKKAKIFLDQGRLVLFSGTPCQIAGLTNYLKKNYANLYTVDLICHGVPSPLIFEEYKQYIESKENILIGKIKFRDKKYSWIFFNMQIEGIDRVLKQKKEYIGTYFCDPYLRGFLRDYFIRPNCHHCVYTTVQRIGDFTIADWWKYKAKHRLDKGFEEKGVSLVFCNTNKAVDIFKHLNMFFEERTINEAITTNKPLSSAFPPSPYRRNFWEDHEGMRFEDLIRKYMYPQSVPLYQRISSSKVHKNINAALIGILKFAYRVNCKIKKYCKQYVN